MCFLQIVTKRQTENQETIRNSVDQFMADVRKLLLKYGADEVINTDQSGIQLLPIPKKKARGYFLNNYR